MQTKSITRKSVKIAIGSRAVLANPFVGDRTSIKQAFRRWLWFVHQGQETLESARQIAESQNNLDFNSKWTQPSREKLMKKLDEILAEFQQGSQLSIGTEAHAEVILSYLEWRSSDR